MRRNIFKWNTIAILLLVVFFQTTRAEEKKYPPYPDVWGIELPVSKSVEHPAFQVIKMPDGDYVITYIKEWILKNEKAKDLDIRKDMIAKYAGISFFTSKETEFSSGNEYNEFMEKMRREEKVISFVPPPPIVFGDGNRIESYTTNPSPPCEIITDRELQKKDANKKIITRKRLLYIFDKPIKKNVCEDGYMIKEISYRQSASWPDSYRLIPLEDETFLIVGFMQHKENPSYFIIRFDKDFKTKSDLMNKNIFLVDASLYENMMHSEYEKIDKAFYEYLTNLKKGEDSK